MTALKNLKALLTDFLYKLGLGKKESIAPAPAPAENEWARPHGTTGLVEAPTLLLTEDDKIVLMVDYDFADFPSWVEWDTKSRKLLIVQMGGAAAELALTMPLHQIGSIGTTKRLMLITGRYERRNGHYVSFIVRE
jgi:hypothetical protein